MTEADLPIIKGIDRLLAGEVRALSWPISVDAQWAVHRPALSFVAQQGDKVIVNIDVNKICQGHIRGAKAPLFISSPSPLKERGTQGVRLINNLSRAG